MLPLLPPLDPSPGWDQSYFPLPLPCKRTWAARIATGTILICREEGESYSAVPPCISSWQHQTQNNDESWMKGSFRLESHAEILSYHWVLAQRKKKSWQSSELPGCSWTPWTLKMLENQHMCFVLYRFLDLDFSWSFQGRILKISPNSSLLFMPFPVFAYCFL